MPPKYKRKPTEGVKFTDEEIDNVCNLFFTETFGLRVNQRLLYQINYTRKWVAGNISLTTSP
jgi:hypothetical protein